MVLKQILEAYGKNVCANIKKKLQQIKKADNDDKDKANDILNSVVMMEIEEDLETDLTNMYIDIYVNGVEQNTADLGVEFTDDETDVFQDAAEEYASQRVAELVKNLDDSTKEMLKNDLDNYMKQGLTPQQIADNLTQNYAFSDSRSLCIARTETGFCWNHASINTSQIGGAKGVRVYDGDYDEDCAEANGQNWSFNYALAHLLQHPNCTRSFGPMSDDDELDKTDDDI